ncbi:ATP-binding cassette domain-containing protein [Pseudoduganella sp. DS3]|uniref:ATP-binding cassette domain-containing protein n=1 Tax=Pseudoduganella guangdongensis TaxID=2692179 RepID=A0A6N9HG37_9BURK|nr:ATP-binding cassette domain-containing protein [Pseudoduganella guangdongensis]MYN02548.1 ATP-binding cassette domain-containing protein [Pseudoduganella guangdongensis]
MHQILPPPLLQLDGATARLGAKHFGPFNLSLRAGERIAVLGPSGAGKSTLLRMMTGELPCAQGTVSFEQQDLRRWPKAALARRRAVLPQGSDVAYGLLVELVIGLGRVALASDPQGERIVREAATLARAGHLLGRTYDTLSGGEQARVQLARIFAQLWDAEAGLVLVDEPLAALDPGLQFDLLESMDAFAAQRGHAVLAILHDINHAMLAFDRLLLVADGQLVGDLAADVGALPALEALYGIGLGSALNDAGDLVVTPRRTVPRTAARLQA